MGNAPNGDVTVVIPLYNGAGSIEETLDSVRAQTLRPVRVVVVDDGSDDDGPSIVARHPLGAELVEQSHLGVAVARNRGLAATRTRWVTFLDQDDLWHPQRLERLFSWLDDHPDARLAATTEIAFSTADEVDELTAQAPLVGSWASQLVPRAAAYATLCARADVTGSDLIETLDLTDLLRGPITVTTSFIADAETLRLAGGFAPHALAMDDYWLLVNAARLNPIVKLDQPTVFYRVHLGATSRSTRLGLPFLSSAVALRLGGGLISGEAALKGGTTGPLHEHLLTELLGSSEYAASAEIRRATGHLASLLWPDGKRLVRLKAEVGRRVPWVRSAIHAVRRRGDSQ